MLRPSLFRTAAWANCARSISFSQQLVGPELTCADRLYEKVGKRESGGAKGKESRSYATAMIRPGLRGCNCSVVVQYSTPIQPATVMDPGIGGVASMQRFSYVASFSAADAAWGWHRSGRGPSFKNHLDPPSSHDPEWVRSLRTPAPMSHPPLNVDNRRSGMGGGVLYRQYCSNVVDLRS